MRQTTACRSRLSRCFAGLLAPGEVTLNTVALALGVAALLIGGASIDFRAAVADDGSARQIAPADDQFFALSLADLKIADGKLPDDVTQASDWRVWQRSQILMPRVVLEGGGEAFIPARSSWGFRNGPQLVSITDPNGKPKTVDLPQIALRVPTGQAARGTMFLANAEATSLVPVKFTVPADKVPGDKALADTAREKFLAARLFHYEALASANRPGAAWFRRQALETRRVLEGRATLNDVLTATPPERRETELFYEREYQIFSGGRAISENLQLDRLLRPTTPAVADQPIDKIAGITVAEMDWKELTKEIDPPLDPLAAAIPADQHAVFLPTFAALLKLMDEADADGTPVLQLIQQRAEDSGTRTRYQKQLCLETDALSRLLGDQVIGSVAFTGGDPYLRTGTDVAVLFEAKSVEILVGALSAKHAAAAKANSGCQTVKGTVAGASYTGVVSPNRVVCSYLATLGKTVIVTNSLVQLERLVKTTRGDETSLASLPEYKFFRHRYNRTDSDETGFLVVTDATIRRWCGPKWRIATGRRTRAAAIQMQHQAAHLDDLVAGTAKPQALTTNLYVPDLGTLSLTKDGVASSTYGTLDFQTPISELDLTSVTRDEAEAYGRWRDTYQQNWRQFFDPIAVRFTVKHDKLAADVTVMPLIQASDYQRFIALAGDAKLAADAGDRHAGTLFHWALAVDKKSEMLRQGGNFLQTFVQAGSGGPFGWLGESIAVYADADPFWAEAAKAEKQNAFFEKEGHRLPVALRAEVSSPLKLAGLLTGIRAFAQQAAPDLLKWETVKHNERSYVKISAPGARQQGAGFLDKMAIHYSVTPKALVVTLNEELLKRSIDREIAAAGPAEGGDKRDANGAKQDDAKKVDSKSGDIEKDVAKDAAKAAEKIGVKGDANAADAKDSAKAAPLRPWLGSSMALQVDRAMIDALALMGQREYQWAMKTRAWAALPILNEWKRRYPNEDPVALHAKRWQATLQCPGGGKYVWNEANQTMESTIYGHPGQPKEGPTTPAPLRTATGANFGVTFEHQGLRARVEIDRAANP